MNLLEVDMARKYGDLKAMSNHVILLTDSTAYLTD
jgi:hypothetical protein